MAESDIAKKLFKMQDAIAEEKTKKSRLEGQKEAVEKKLLNEFDCKGIRQVKSKLKSLASAIEKKEDELITRMDKLEESGNFDHD